MTLKQFSEKLNKLVEENPELLEMEIVTEVEKDNEDNDRNLAYICLKLFFTK